MSVQFQLTHSNTSIAHTRSPKPVKSHVNKGDVNSLPKKVNHFVRYVIDLCTPGAVFICDGTDAETEQVVGPWVNAQIVNKIGNDKNSFLFRTDPRDAGQTDKTKTTFCTPNTDYSEYQPSCKENAQAGGQCDQKTAFSDVKSRDDTNFTHCMKERTMFVIPFTLGLTAPPGYRFGVFITDSPFAYMAIKKQFRIPNKAWTYISGEQDSFIKCLHSVGCPRPVKVFVRHHWACNPDSMFTTYHLEDKRIKSFGSGYLNPSSFILPLLMDSSSTNGRVIVSTLSILSVRTPHGKEFFVALGSASDSEALGLAEMVPSIPGYNIKIIACGGLTFIWVDGQGVLRASNPAIGFTGQCMGCSNDHCPQLLQTLKAKSLLLNTAVTSDGQFYWEGLEDTLSREATITNWKGLPCPTPTDRESGEAGSNPPAAHPNCRYFCQYAKYPCVRPGWDSTEGFPLSAIIWSCKRQTGIPLVNEFKTWTQGILAGACLRSDVIEGQQQQPQQQQEQQQQQQRQERQQKPQPEPVQQRQPEDRWSSMRREPMGMPDVLIPASGMGDYLGQWLNLEHRLSQAPRIYRVNWWSRPQDGQQDKAEDRLWPGKVDNVRVLDWIVRRCDDHHHVSMYSPVGILPRHGTVNMTGLDDVDLKAILTIDKHFWLQETSEDRSLLESLCGESTPFALYRVLKQREEDCRALPEGYPNIPVCGKPSFDRCYTCLGPAPGKEIVS